MTISTQLYQGEHICLGPINYEKDPEVESRWTHNSAYLHSLGPKIARPLSPAQIKKRYEAIEKEVEESKNFFYFSIRSRADDRLLGCVRLFWVEWTNATGGIQVAIGNPAERDQPYAQEALQLVLCYAFTELNLRRLTLIVFDYNPRARRSYEKCGFVHEGTVRGVLQREGRRWDWHYMGILKEEWEQRIDK